MKLKRKPFKLPEDWLYKFLSIPVNTSLTLYLFSMLTGVNAIEYFWEDNEKNHIKSFLILQGFLAVLFSIGLTWVLEIPILKLAESRIKKYTVKPSLSSYKELSQAKIYLVRFFSFKVQKGRWDASDFKEELIIPNKDERISELVNKTAKWMSLLVQVAITLSLVLHLNAWYIVPVIVIILTLILFFIVAAVVVLHNIEFLEKIRAGVIKRHT